MKRETLDTALAKADIAPTRPTDRDAIARTADYLTRSADQLSAWLAKVET